MARSNVQTWLPLDRWAEIIGLNPLHWNQLVSTRLVPGTVCGDVFFQYSWQHSDRLGRDDIAMAIQAAELEIAAEVGYNLLPDWTVEERLPYPQPFVPEVFNTWGTNVRGVMKSVELRRAHIISGGVKTKSLIQAGIAIVRSDPDVDQFQELCTVTVPTSVTDINEIRAFYPAQNGADGWEIRPITVTLSGANAIITFKIWQVVAANQLDAINAQPLEAEGAATFETTIDVYRVYNDPSTQAQFMWENSEQLNCCGTCIACQFSTQAGCFHLRDARLGLAVPTPGTWVAADQSFSALEWSACREPDQVRLWYYSGIQDLSLARPKVQMSHYWEYSIAYLAASKLDRPVCGCSNVQQFIDKWRRDAMFSSEEEGAMQLTPDQAGNHMGTSLGALYAWRQIQRNGVKVLK